MSIKEKVERLKKEYNYARRMLCATAHEVVENYTYYFNDTKRVEWYMSNFNDSIPVDEEEAYSHSVVYWLFSLVRIGATGRM